LLKIFYEEVVFVLSFHVLAMMIFLFNYRHKGIKISEITVQGETYLLSIISPSILFLQKKVVTLSA
jgi:hypothetical protein